jgi:carbohydrate-binding DOMON domain-containing protein
VETANSYLTSPCRIPPCLPPLDQISQFISLVLGCITAASYGLCYNTTHRTHTHTRGRTHTHTHTHTHTNTHTHKHTRTHSHSVRVESMLSTFRYNFRQEVLPSAHPSSPQHQNAKHLFRLCIIFEVNKCEIILLRSVM